MKSYPFIHKLIFTIIICAAALLLCFIFQPTFAKHYEMQTHYFLMKQKLAQEKSENQRLKQELNNLTNDPSWIEKAAREKLGWCSPDETVYRFQTSDSEK